MKSTLWFSGLWPAIVLAVVLPGGALAQPYPNKAIRFIVPYAPGGSVDIVSRVIAPKLAESFGQQVVVDNRPGAGAIIGTNLLAKSAPDGYTILMADIALGANPALHSKLPYNTPEDFAPVTLVALLPSILVVHPSLPVKSVKELIALARSKAGQLNYSTAGAGSMNYLATELFKSQTGTDIVHIPYQSGGQALTALLSGQVQLVITTVPPVLPYIKAGRVRYLAVSGTKRMTMLPDAPTFAEAGMPAFDVYLWQAVVAPAGTPSEIITRLNADINRVLAIAEIRERIAGLGADVVGGTPERLTDFIKAEIARWSKAIKPNMRVD